MYRGRSETCGIRIKKALLIRDMKQADLCKFANVPKSSLSLYLSGAYEPKQDRIYTMAKVLNVSEAWLMGYDVPMDRERATSHNESKLTEGERMMLDLFRQIPEGKQKIVLQMIRLALETQG